MTDETKPADDEQRRDQSILTMSVYDSAVEQIIREAQDEGKFEDLRGHGKPLKLDENAYAGDQELAYKLLKDNGYTLPWIADRNDTLEQVEQFRSKIHRQWRTHGDLLKIVYEMDDRPPPRWVAIRSQWEAQIDALNRRIDEVNLSIPAEQLHLIKLTMSVELIRLGVPPAWE